MKSKQKIKNLDEEDFEMNFKNDENMQNKNINQIFEEENEYLNNNEREDISNPFAHISDKIEEKKPEAIYEANLNVDMLNANKNYIKIKDIKQLSDSKNIVNFGEIGKNLNNITNPEIKKSLKNLISNGAKFIENNIKTNVLNSLDINGTYLLLDKNNDKYGNNFKFSLNNIMLNSDI